MRVGQFEDIADRFASIPRDELDAATAWLAESSFVLSSRSRQLAECFCQVLEAVKGGADVRLAVQVLADALNEQPASGRRVVPLRTRLDALTNPHKGDS